MTVPEHRLIVAARALLNWTQRDLAEVSEVSLGTILRFEQNKVNPIPANRKAIYGALSDAGVQFLANGVTLCPKPAPQETTTPQNTSASTPPSDASAPSSPPSVVPGVVGSGSVSEPYAVPTLPTGFTS